MHRHLDVTARTTLDHVEAIAEGVDWTDEAVAVLDVESPAGRDVVRVGLELDPLEAGELPHHVQYVPLDPDQARTLAADLEEAADAAEAGEKLTSRRG